MQVDGILETCVYADDLVAAERFYRDVVGLPIHAHEEGRHVFFRCGNGMFLVFDPQRTASTTSEVAGVAIPKHGASGAGHVCFRVAVEALPGWRDRLRDRAVEIEAEVTWPNGASSVYFRDPAGNSVELASPSLWGLAESPSQP